MYFCVTRLSPNRFPALAEIKLPYLKHNTNNVWLEFNFHVVSVKVRLDKPQLCFQPMNIESLMLVSASIFCIGLYGFLTSKNVVRILMSLELLLNAININLVSFSTFLDSQELKGQVFALFVITIAAAESAIALAILLSIYRNKESISMEQFNLLKW